MKIGVILNYFRYFLAFPRREASHSYSFATMRKRFLRQRDARIRFCNGKDAETLAPRWRVKNVEDYFVVSRRFNALPPTVDLERLSAWYELWFNRFLEEEKIDVLIGGATTGFERAGMAAAKRNGIRTLYVWEGFFRPDTISIDPVGMNAESSFRRMSFPEILNTSVKTESREFVESYIDTLRRTVVEGATLSTIQQGKFNLIRQGWRRAEERNDIERIRLPIRQHAWARALYYLNRRRYAQLSDLKKPFLYLPLQTHTDSNVVLNADLFPFSGYVQLVQEGFSLFAAKTGFALAIKEHPFDVFRIAYRHMKSSSVLWLRPEIPSLSVLNHPLCAGTVVVNSTAGFESLLMGKPVLCLGRALYGYSQLVEKPEVGTPEGICAALERTVHRRINDSMIKQFSTALFDTCQVLGNLDDIPTTEHFRAFRRNVYGASDY